MDLDKRRVILDNFHYSPSKDNKIAYSDLERLILKELDTQTFDKQLLETLKDQGVPVHITLFDSEYEGYLWTVSRKNWARFTKDRDYTHMQFESRDLDCHASITFLHNLDKLYKDYRITCLDMRLSAVE